MSFDTSGLTTDVERAAAQRVIDTSDYPWESHFQNLKAKTDAHSDVQRLENTTANSPGISYPWEGRACVAAGLDAETTARTLMHELGHCVDWSTLTDDQRRVVRIILDDGYPVLKDPWLSEHNEPNDYPRRVGEAFAETFATAYMPGVVPRFDWPTRPVTLRKAAFIRAYLTPDLPAAEWLKPRGKRHQLVATWKGGNTEGLLSPGTLQQLGRAIDLGDNLRATIEDHIKKGHVVRFQ